MALSDERIAEVCSELEQQGDTMRQFARTIEAEVRKQDEALIRQMMEALELPPAGCRDLHHRKAEQHAYGEPCQPEARYAAAITAARARLEGKP